MICGCKRADEERGVGETFPSTERYKQSCRVLGYEERFQKAEAVN